MELIIDRDIKKIRFLFLNKENYRIHKNTQSKLKHLWGKKLVMTFKKGMDWLSAGFSVITRRDNRKTFAFTVGKHHPHDLWCLFCFYMPKLSTKVSGMGSSTLWQEQSTVIFTFSLLNNNNKDNIDSMLKTRDITLPTKVCPVKAMFFTVVMYGCDE